MAAPHLVVGVSRDTAVRVEVPPHRGAAVAAPVGVQVPPVLRRWLQKEEKTKEEAFLRWDDYSNTKLKQLVKISFIYFIFCTVDFDVKNISNFWELGQP